MKRVVVSVSQFHGVGRPASQGGREMVAVKSTQKRVQQRFELVDAPPLRSVPTPTLTEQLKWSRGFFWRQSLPCPFRDKETAGVRTQRFVSETLHPVLRESCSTGVAVLGVSDDLVVRFFNFFSCYSAAWCCAWCRPLFVCSSLGWIRSSFMGFVISSILTTHKDFVHGVTSSGQGAQKSWSPDAGFPTCMWPP